VRRVGGVLVQTINSSDGFKIVYVHLYEIEVRNLNFGFRTILNRGVVSVPCSWRVEFLLRGCDGDWGIQ
jgi:hypothetical protein